MFDSFFTLFMQKQHMAYYYIVAMHAWSSSSKNNMLLIESMYFIFFVMFLSVFAIYTLSGRYTHVLKMLLL